MAVEAKKLRSDLPEIIGYNEEENSEEDEEEAQRKTIAEAFADDDVMADFHKEKAAIIAASKPKAGSTSFLKFLEFEIVRNFLDSRLKQSSLNCRLIVSGVSYFVLYRFRVPEVFLSTDPNQRAILLQIREHSKQTLA